MSFLMKKTGTIIHGIEEYNYEGVRFLYRQGKEKTIISFSAFAPKNVSQSYNYVKDFLDTDYSYFGFLDSEGPEEDPRGTYYLDSKLGNSYLDKINFIIQYLTFGKCDKNKTWLVGSSKAGVGALLLGVTYNYPNIIIMAPQCRIAKYIQKRSKIIYDYFIEKLQVTHVDLDNALLQRIKEANNYIDWNINILCGKDDNYHIVELDILSRCFWMRGITISQGYINGAHDRIAIEEYRSYFKKAIVNS